MSFKDTASSFKTKIKSSWPCTLAVSLIALLALWVRMRPSAYVFNYFTDYFNGFVRFGGNDPWYHMRLVNVLLENYPHRMFFDPMTNYPNGSYIHFGPLFDQMIAIICLILGVGNPSTELINNVGVYFPAVLGALVVIPVYYIGKTLGGRKVGILAAILIAFAPGQFLQRSLMGFTDHHVAETLFSTFFIMFFMLAVISSKKNRIRFEHIKNKEWNKLKGPIAYSVMAGVMYSAYQLSWPGAPLFELIVLIYALFQYILDNLRKENSDYLAITGIITFFVSLILILPFVHPDMGLSMFYYSWFHVIVPFVGIVSFAALSFIEREFKKRSLKTYYYPLAIFGLCIFGLIALKIAVPSLYSLVISAPGMIFEIKTGGQATIGEASSIFYPDNAEVFTYWRVYQYFTAPAFWASILGMLGLAISLIRKPKPEKLLPLVWGLLMLLAIYGQNRFAYYYSANIAVLVAYLGGLVLELVKWDQLGEGFRTSVKSLEDVPNFLKSVKIEQVFVILFIFVVVVMPEYEAAMAQSAGTGGPNVFWIESMLWLNSSTPDPGMDYNAIYEAPENGEAFQYPDTAYGVMSWWDYGHWIETIGHRLPNANPFQAGVGGRSSSINDENRPGASTFLTAQSEEEATAVLEAIDPDPDKAGARYVVSDVEMATGKFVPIISWTLDTEGYFAATGSGYGVPTMRFYNSMEQRLHLFDGTGLKHYRMVHESWIVQTDEIGYKQVFNYYYFNQLDDDDPRAQSQLDENYTGYVKIFEYVKGANITGTAAPNETVKISTTIMTTQGRDFGYFQSTTADSNGEYEFTVPYSTTGPISGETQFDTAPISLYVVSYGNTTKSVSVSEEAVLNGEEIKI
jgi:oligosaccharyl transferase (archaeosortase A-associated)